MELFKLWGTVALRDEEARRGLDNIDKKAEGTSSKIGGFFGKAGSLMGSAVVAGATAAGAGLVTLTGIIGKVGIDYNSMIENSQVAWTTLLGTQGKAKDMLKEIATFAKTTQFETEQVDMMAKYMHNAGLEGKALFDELTKVADVSGAFNIPAAEAQELTRQMSQVRQAGLAYTEDLNVLQDRGIPIYKAISDQLGITVADVKKMASEGKLTSDIYLKSFDNIAKGVEGSSEKQSKTFTGMISTLKDNLKMISGELTKGAFEKMKGVLEDVMPVLDKFLSNLKDGGLKGAIAGLFPPGMADNIKGFTDGVSGAFGAVKNGIQEYKDFVKSAFSGDGNVGESFSKIFKSIKDVALPILKDAIDFVKEKFGELKAFWDENGAQIVEAVQNAWSMIASIISFFMPAIQLVIQTVLENIKGIISGALDIIMGVIKIFTGLFTGDFSLMWEGIKQLFSGAFEFLWNLFNLLMIGKFLGGIKSFISSGISSFRSFVDDIVNMFKGWGDNIISTFNNLRSKGTGIWNSMISAVKNTMGPFVSNIKTRFGEVLDNALSIFRKVKDAIMNPVRTAKNAVKGFVEEIKGFFRNMKLKLPDIKMPHFKVKNWSMNPKDWLKAMPSLGVDWYATGTNFAPGGLTMVGERGPELVRLPRGSKVDTTSETKQMMGNTINFEGMMSGATFIVREEVDIKKIAQELRDLTVKAARSKGVVMV
ncbi:tape measure protein [Mesobacillus zeae]|uniref:Tape measure protein N-terminal domain-containing protein n=1 Tax=Mesobacillus zeae TaxID=1917180 RepID=A0A398BDE6_9BACI|nr:tape measure protein [Mesobacillus zeae]RID85676.1 hypothetical protein D1970_08970 [Mesobacillus zeae]